MNRKRKTMRTIRRVCNAIAAASFLLIVGTIGGIENNSVELIPGAIAAALLVGTFGISLKLADALSPVHRKGAAR